ncbi:hypothetical protein [Clostridium weizhouense]|uniref:Uncharacterized protein n=1 Tax=Clostridium weizhouense TaxID=2859781 RepID=A0ABS7APE3_9CLOT|nr:hypothetical protein [Clostridium weizhouense]MBW6410526.1 hypothetical protein [Clostridium weizhouense]
MEFLTGAFFIVGILFMCVFMFIGIWLFVVALKAHSQLRYHNYILEKICEKLSNLSNITPGGELKNNNYDSIKDDIPEINENNSYNISSFDKTEKFN